MNSPRKHTSKIQQRLQSSGDRIRRARLPKRLRLAMKIAEAIEAQDLNNKDLAESLGKYSSEISKWLKGDHNFTVDTLSDIEEILNIRLLDVGESKEETKDTFIMLSVSQPNNSSFDKLNAIKGQKISHWQAIS